jgi:hypothetical protein
MYNGANTFLVRTTIDERAIFQALMSYRRRTTRILEHVQVTQKGKSIRPPCRTEGMRQ